MSYSYANLESLRIGLGNQLVTIRVELQKVRHGSKRAADRNDRRNFEDRGGRSQGEARKGEEQKDDTHRGRDTPWLTPFPLAESHLHKLSL